MNVKRNSVQGWRRDSNSTDSCEYSNELSSFVKIPEFPSSALQFLLSKEVLVLLIQASSLEARCGTHTQHIVHMRPTKYKEEKKQCPA